MIDVRSVDERRARTIAPLLAGWAYEAGSPLEEWRFGDEPRALKSLTAWVLRPSSEVALRRWKVAFQEELPVGGYVAMPDFDLLSARRSDLLALVSSADRIVDLRERLAATNDLFEAVEPGDFYLSRVAVEPSARGRGLGAQLVAAVVDAAARTGATAVRADVWAANEPAMALYRSLGFEIGPERISERAGFSYRAVRLAM